MRALDDVRIRTRLIAIFLLPILTLTIVAASQIQSSVAAGFRADKERQLLTFAIGLGDLGHELQLERDHSVNWIGSGKEAASYKEVLVQRARVDRAIGTDWDQASESVHKAEQRGFTRQVAAVREKLGQLSARRQAIDQLPLSPTEVLPYYTELIRNILGLNTDIAAAGLTPAVYRSATAYVAMSQAKEAVSYQRGFGAAVLATGRFRGNERETFADAVGAEATWTEQFDAFALDEQQNLYQPWLSGSEAQRGTRLAESLAKQAGQGNTNIAPDQWLAIMSGKVEAFRQVEQRLAAEMLRANRADALSHARSLTNNILVTLIVVALAVAFALHMERSMVRPLAALRSAARSVARRRLPGVVERLSRNERVDPQAEADPVHVTARDEIGQVAEAFNSAHRAAVDLALEQAALRKSVGDMFLNLARRSQALIDRQLELIDKLERDETDADALQELFRLDHLATRLRRNAEDLIVLSGAKPARRWSRPVTLYEVVRAATAEVEDYTRIELLPIDEVGVTGQGVADVIHLLAELVENATSFSPPGTMVHIAGQPVLGGYMIEIEDRGVGMSDAELLEVNERLANPPRVDLGLSRKLGLYVVSRLAARYGVRVQLRHSWYGGITVLVVLPDSLLVQPAGVATPSRPGLAGAHAPEAVNGSRALPAPPSLSLPGGSGGARRDEPQPAAWSNWFEQGEMGKDYVPLRRHAAQPGEGMVMPPSPRELRPDGRPPTVDLRRADGVPEQPAAAPEPPAAPADKAPPDSAPPVDVPRTLPRRNKGQHLPGAVPDGAGVAVPPNGEPAGAPGNGEGAGLTEPGGGAGLPPMEPAMGGMPVDAAALGDGLGAGDQVAADGPPTAPAGEPTVQVTKVGLPRRVPKANLAPGLAADGAPQQASESGAPTGMRTPEQVRSMLSSYRTGIERGRQSSSSQGEGPPSEDDTLVGGDTPPFPSRGRRGSQ
jgi:HAMP domain-containing protein